MPRFNKFEKLDQLSRPAYFPEDDSGFYLGDYSSRGSGNPITRTSRNIMDLKIDLDNPPHWMNRAQATEKKAAMAKFWSQEIGRLVGVCKSTTLFIPAPPSKVVGDPGRDDRLHNVLSWASKAHSLPWSPVVETEQNRASAHAGGASRDPDDLYANLLWDAAALPTGIKTVVVFDDVLTSGATYSAIRRLVRENIADVTTHGMFLARCI